jgi:hypothetical protein
MSGERPNFMKRQQRFVLGGLASLGILSLAATPNVRAQEGVGSPPIIVEGQALPSPTPHDDWKAKLDHIMSEVSGTEITVTKKATVIKLDQQPTVTNNNLQQLFTKAPGLLVTEQNTPGQFNLSYRGLGNPQESEFVTVLMDGVPLASDWIGFPTLYFLPVPQSVTEIQEIRGGSSLLYGPQPAPAVNYVTRRPDPGSPWHFYTEQIVFTRLTTSSRKPSAQSSSGSTASMPDPTASGTTASTTNGNPTFMSAIGLTKTIC